MPTIQCNDVQLAYEEGGAGDPPLLFVHGWTCDRSMFAPQAEHFSRDHRVISVDLRGHGESDKPEGDYPIATYARDLAEFLGQLQPGKVVAVGHSMGGQAVLQLAAEHPDLVAAIVMVDPAPILMPAEGRKRLEGLVASTRNGDQGPREVMVDNFFLPTSDPEIKADVRRRMLASPDHVAAAAMQGVVDFDGPGAAAKCTVPALHIAASAPLNPVHVLQEQLPHVVSGQTVGTGHFNHLEAPTQVNGMIESFLFHHVGVPSS